MEKQGNAITGRQRCEDAFDNNLRTLAVVDLASLHGADGFEGSLDRPVEDLLDYLLDTAYKTHPSAAALQKAAVEADEDTIGILGELLYHRNLLGLAVQFATPVMTKTSSKSWSFSWGYTQTTWVYAETYEDAWRLGVAWAEQCRAEAKPAQKRRRAAAATA